jgi:hypothetical protein
MVETGVEGDPPMVETGVEGDPPGVAEGLVALPRGPPILSEAPGPPMARGEAVGGEP